MVNNVNQISGKAMAVLLGVGLIFLTFFINEGLKEIAFWLIGAILIYLGIRE